MLTPGNVSDVAAAPALFERASGMRHLLGGVADGAKRPQGYDADRLQRSLHETGTIAVIPGRRNRKRTIRYDKLAANFLSSVALATAVAFWL